MWWAGRPATVSTPTYCHARPGSSTYSSPGLVATSHPGTGAPPSQGACMAAYTNTRGSSPISPSLGGTQRRSESMVKSRAMLVPE